MLLLCSISWIVLTSRLAASYSRGAPNVACGDMTPWHGTPPTSDPCPYRLTSNAKCFRPGQKITLLLKDPAGQSFRGLMVQALESSGSSSQSYGVFDLNSNTGMKLLDCFGSKSNAITHSNSNDKLEKVFDWIPPEDFSRPAVNLTFTVVKEYTRIWTQQKLLLPLCVDPATTSVRPLTTGPRPSTGLSTAKNADVLSTTGERTITSPPSSPTTAERMTATPTTTRAPIRSSILFSTQTTTTTTTTSPPPSSSSSSPTSATPTPTTTSFRPSCVDADPSCSGINPKKCYGDYIRSRCCRACSQFASMYPQSGGCEYGDKISICGFFRYPKFCRYYMDECCYTCGKLT